MLSLIAAAAENNAIGKNNQLLWSLPADLRHFKEVTQGHTVIMGRKTFESIGRPLPNRRNIVITRNPEFHPEGIEVINSLEEAFRLILPEEEAFVIGGAELYKQTVPLAQRIYLTRVKGKFEADAFFPELGPEWEEVSREEGVMDDKNLLPHTFLLLERK